MKGFFSNMNFPRFIILICFLSSAVLGYFVYERTQYLAKVERDLVSVQSVIREIQQNAMELERLQQLSRDDRFKEDQSAESFIREISTNRAVQLGQVDIDNTSKPQGRGIVDKIYTLSPLLKKEQKFRRDQIGNFLYLLEEKGSHVKVTSIDLRPHGKFRAGEITNDEWTYEIKLTSRTKRE